VKLNDAGVMVAFERLGANGWGRLNEPEMLQSGGHVAEPEKLVKGLPVMLYVVDATTGTSVPVPVRETLSWELTKTPCELVITSEALFAPKARGVKVTKIWQLFPGNRTAGEIGQLFVCPKPAEFAPEMAMLEMETLVSPVSLTVTVCARVVVEVTALPKARLDGEMPSVAPVNPVPLRLKLYEGCAGSLVEKERVPNAGPTAPGLKKA